MNVLFVHNNFPAQYKHLVGALLADPAHKVAAIGAATARDIPGVDLHRYDLAPEGAAATHPFARRFDFESRRAEQVLYAASSLLSTGFRPDTILVHSGWGENLPMRSVFPDARIINYCEFHYRPKGQDVNFDPEFPRMSLDGVTALSAKNAMGLLGLVDCDVGLSPTEWQRSTYPVEFHPKIRVIHEGIDTDLIRPDPNATFDLPNGTVLKKGDEVVTYVSRNLEPLRGYHIFMRALPRLLRERPQAQVLIVGATQSAYGQIPPPGKTWKDIFLEEVRSELDLSRVHFLGQIPYDRFLRLLQVSAAHVYLTYPFVLSWSCLEAMSSGCVVIGADVPPITEVVDDTNGIVVPFFDIERLTDTIAAVLKAPARYDKLRAEARAAVIKRFDARTICIPAALRLLSHG